MKPGHLIPACATVPQKFEAVIHLLTFLTFFPADADGKILFCFPTISPVFTVLLIF
jgi:hypothetical protein